MVNKKSKCDNFILFVLLKNQIGYTFHIEMEMLPLKWVCSSYGRVFPSQGKGSGIDARHIHFFLKKITIFSNLENTMYEETKEQAITGLNESIKEIVKKFEGQYSEPEILSAIIDQTKLLFATSKVKYTTAIVIFILRELFTTDLEYCSAPIVDPATGKVAEDMEDLSKRISVVRIHTFAEADEVHTIAVLNVAYDEKV